MATKACIFELKSKQYFYFDNLRNLRNFWIDEIDTSKPVSPLEAELTNIYCRLVWPADTALEVFKHAPSVTSPELIKLASACPGAWAVLVREFASSHRDGIFFIVSDNDIPHYEDVIERDGYTKFGV